MDYYTLAKEGAYLAEAIKGASVAKVYQGERGITLRLRHSPAPFLNFFLDPEYSSFFLSREPLFEDHGHFAGLLERHLKGARLKAIHHPKGDRVFYFDFVHVDFVGKTRSFSLIFEVLGRHSNMVFCQENRILDAWSGYSPGRLYLPPQSPRGIYLGDAERDRVLEVIALKGIDGLAEEFYPVPRFLLRRLKDLCGELSPQGLVRFWEAFEGLRGELFSPYLWLVEGRPYPFAVDGARKVEVDDGLKEAVLGYIRLKALEETRRRLKKVVSARIKRLRSLMERLRRELEEAADYERFRLWGETIYINMNRITPNQELLVVENPYRPDEVLEIPIKGNNPSATAQEYFSIYSRLKSKREKVEKRIEEVASELSFLEDLLWQIEEARDGDVLSDIEDVLVEQGYIIKRGRKRLRGQRPSYLELDIDGYKVLVGRNSRANDYVTFRLAGREDLWLHVKNYPGAHVVVKGRDIPADVVEKAASVAAYFSRAKEASKVEVDYTKVKNVHRGKPPRPGFVWYKDYSTIVVTPKSPEEVADVEKG